VPTSNQYLLISSSEPYSGKTATVLGLASQLQERGIDFSYGKPIGTCCDDRSSSSIDDDVQFLTKQLNLSADRIVPTVLTLDAHHLQKRITGEDTTDYSAHIQDALNHGSGLMLLEGANTLIEATAFNLSTSQLANQIDASVLLVVRYHAISLVDTLLSARAMLGDRLLGVTINDIPLDEMDDLRDQVVPYLEAQGIPILGLLPFSPLLNSVSVAEIVRKLEGEVLCCQERLDLMVEGIQVGAMSVNSAIKYFQNAHNTAIVTGGDRADIQLAALETATHCLVLTGHRLMPPKMVLDRAEELEIPVLSVELDTLTTIERIESMFGQMRVQEPMKVNYIKQLIAEHFDVDRLLAHFAHK